jgi:hypothetical protein
MKHPRKQTRRAAVRQIDITRTLLGFKKAGVDISRARAEIDPDTRKVLIIPPDGAAAPVVVTPFQAWKAKRNARAS